jgi:hypothetical protein
MRILVFVGIVSLCWAANAEPSNSVITGAGTRTCGEFAAEYRKEPTLIGTIYLVWAQGFMAGLNVQRAFDDKPMRNIGVVNPDRQALALQQACDRRPLASYYQVVFDYFETLPLLDAPPVKLAPRRK